MSAHVEALFDGVPVGEAPALLKLALTAVGAYDPGMWAVGDVDLTVGEAQLQDALSALTGEPADLNNNGTKGPFVQAVLAYVRADKDRQVADDGDEKRDRKRARVEEQVHRAFEADNEYSAAQVDQMISTAVGRALKKAKLGGHQQQQQQQQIRQKPQAPQAQQKEQTQQARRGGGGEHEPGEKLTGPRAPPTGGWTAENLPTSWHQYAPVSAMSKAHKKSYGAPHDLPEGSKGECLGNLYAKCKFGAEKCSYFHSDTVLTNEEKATTANEAVRMWEAGEVEGRRAD